MADEVRDVREIEPVALEELHRYRAHLRAHEGW